MADILERLEGYDYTPQEAIDEIKKLRSALECADRAINPPDRSGISLHEWDKRLKAASKTIRSVLFRQPVILTETDIAALCGGRR